MKITKFGLLVPGNRITFKHGRDVVSGVVTKRYDSTIVEVLTDGGVAHSVYFRDVL
jgi:hypothetical protein